MRRDMEPLLFEAGVDLVLSGHVHAYERSRPVYDGCSHPCGPVYLNLGDGGNRESAYVPWREPQPAWSAFRESSFGVGLLTLVNETHARFNWTRAACASLDAAEGHVDWDHRHCFTRTHYGEDNSATRLADTDGAWLVRSADRSCSQPAEGACDPAVPPAAPPPPPPPPPGERFSLEYDVGGRASAAGLGFLVGAAFMAASTALFPRACRRRRQGGGRRQSSDSPNEVRTGQLVGSGGRGAAGVQILDV
uniref:Purple acid phosphatase C-terminal domain-containing protein n=2 Tax=Emiliania huxleyi TaxID=2903 RepID=A0A7S3T7S2_EMIHU